MCLPSRDRAVNSAAQPVENHAAILKIQSSRSSSEGRFQGRGTDCTVKKVKINVRCSNYHSHKLYLKAKLKKYCSYKIRGKKLGIVHTKPLPPYDPLCSSMIMCHFPVRVTDSYKTPVQPPTMNLLFCHFWVLNFITQIRLLYHTACSQSHLHCQAGGALGTAVQGTYIKEACLLLGVSATWSSSIWVNVFDFKCMNYWHDLLLQHLLLTDLRTSRTEGVILSRVMYDDNSAVASQREKWDEQGD